LEENLAALAQTLAMIESSNIDREIAAAEYIAALLEHWDVKLSDIEEGERQFFNSQVDTIINFGYDGDCVEIPQEFATF